MSALVGRTLEHCACVWVHDVGGGCAWGRVCVCVHGGGCVCVHGGGCVCVHGGGGVN